MGRKLYSYRKPGAVLALAIIIAIGGICVRGPEIGEAGAADEGSQVQEYVDLMYAYDDPAYSEQKAIALAAEAIRDYYAVYEVEKKAVPALEDVLESVNPVPARTAIRFILADLHKKLNQPDKALQQYKTIIQENQADLTRRGY